MKKKDWWRTDIKVEFDQLKTENPNIIGWIRFDNQDGLGINYPIVYSGDNEKYLRKDIYGNEHIVGIKSAISWEKNTRRSLTRWQKTRILIPGSNQSQAIRS